MFKFKFILAALAVLCFAPILHAAAIAVTVSSGTLQAGTSIGFHTSSGTVRDLNTSTLSVTNMIGIGTKGIAGKPDANISIVNSGLPGQPSRQGIDIDATNNGVSKLPFLIFTNKSTPAFGIGGCIAFLQQLPSTADNQQGILAFSQDTTTNTANFQLYLRAGGTVASDSVPVFSVFGKPSGVGVSSNTIGYGYAMFGPTGADSVGTPFGSYNPGSTVHIASDFGDDTDGIRLERRSTPNPFRYQIRVDSSGSLIVGTVGAYASDPIIAIVGATGQINIQGAISSTRQIISKGTTIAEDLGEGYVSQYVSSYTVANISFGTSGQFANVVQISLSSGDWTVSGSVAMNLNGATASGQFYAAISTYSANTTTDHLAGRNQLPGFAPTTEENSISIPDYRILTAANVTCYLKVKGTFSSGPPRSVGSLTARRVH